MGLMLANNRQYEAKNAMDAALDVGALFEPKRTPTILPNGTMDTDTFTIYREMSDGSQVVLNAGVKKNYYAGSYATLLETAEAMFPNSVTGMQVFGNGQVLVFVQDIGIGTSFDDGDELTTHIMWTASLDSTFASAAHGFAFRPFCTNQLRMSTLQLAQKRTLNHDGLMFSKARIMAEAHNRFDAFVGNARMLKALPLTPLLKKRVLDEVAPLVTDPDAAQKAINHAERRRDGILYFLSEEVERFGENAYSLYQAVNSYEFHTATKGKNQELKQVKQVSGHTPGVSLTSQAQALLLAAV